MAKVLVRFHDTMIKHNHFLFRLLDVLDRMIGKGKGNKTNKIRVKQIIEANLQLLMIFFSTENSRKL